MMDEYINGEKVRHGHLFQEFNNNQPEGLHGSKNGSLIHEHAGSELHLHPIIEVWEDWVDAGQATFYFYAPAVDLLEPSLGWDGN